MTSPIGDGQGTRGGCALLLGLAVASAAAVALCLAFLIRSVL